MGTVERYDIGELLLFNGEGLTLDGKFTKFQNACVSVTEHRASFTAYCAKENPLYKVVILDGPCKGQKVHVFHDELQPYRKKITQYTEKLPLI